ncbi:hypothetical protein [Sphingomonas psychrotolerans]|uniref:hypothetical protein n=1 Tax=Sphingomonas psychrotolerans TaxID=1327635 RepID=UPI0013052B77|nr:hypothetical protein [Sphingomonas psychrotolerans]
MATLDKKAIALGNGFMAASFLGLMEQLPDECTVFVTAEAKVQAAAPAATAPDFSQIL